MYFSPILKVYSYIALFMLVFLGVIEFSIWSQVLYVHETEWGSFSISSYYHVPRYFVVYPSFYFYELFPFFVLDKWFSIYVVFAFIFSVNLLSSSLVKLSDGFFSALNLKKNHVYFFILIAMFPILFLINGRGVFGILSASILLYLYSYKNQMSVIKVLIVSFLVLFFSSVSSGFFIIAFSSLLMLFIYKIKIYSKKIIFTGFFIIVFAYFSMDIVSYIFSKNINFYGGGWSGFYNMLNHGFGKFFLGKDLFFLVQVFLILLFSIINFILIFQLPFIKRHFYLLSVILITFIVGVFGYTSLSYSIPFIILFLFIMANSIKFKYNKDAGGL